jgi:hypothetical protein
MEGTSILTNGVAFREEASAEDLGRCDGGAGAPDLHRAVPTTRVPEAFTRRVLAASLESRMASLLSKRFGPRSALSAQAERVARNAGMSSSRFAGPRCGNASRRPTQLASVGAGEQRGESPTRVRRSAARWVCPCVVIGCRSRRATPRSREARHPLAAGRVNEDLASGRGSGWY